MFGALLRRTWGYSLATRANASRQTAVYNYAFCVFPEVRLRILAATLLRTEKSWFLSELAAFLSLRPSSLQREVESLSEAGILRQWRDGRRLYFAADRSCPIFSGLAHLLDECLSGGPMIFTLTPARYTFKESALKLQ